MRRAESTGQPNSDRNGREAKRLNLMVPLQGPQGQMLGTLQVEFPSSSHRKADELELLQSYSRRLVDLLVRSFSKHDLL